MADMGTTMTPRWAAGPGMGVPVEVRREIVMAVPVEVRGEIVMAVRAGGSWESTAARYEVTVRTVARIMRDGGGNTSRDVPWGGLEQG